jgi:hypothetical protein
LPLRKKAGKIILERTRRALCEFWKRLARFARSAFFVCEADATNLPRLYGAVRISCLLLLLVHVVPIR